MIAVKSVVLTLRLVFKKDFFSHCTTDTTHSYLFQKLPGTVSTSVKHCANILSSAATMSTRITRRKGSFTEAEKESTAECAVVPEKAVAPKAIEKVPITLVVDNSNEKIGIMHYLAMFIWLGWPSIYLTLMLTFPLLFLYARPVLMVIVIVLTTSAIYPIDIRKQPKVCLAHGFSCIHCIPLTCALFTFLLLQWAMDFGASLMK
jgi:hypothetical protein